MVSEVNTTVEPARSRNRLESLALAFILVAAFHAVPYWTVYQFLPAKRLFNSLGGKGFANLWDAITLILPLVLCLVTPRRSGLVLGAWRGHVVRVMAICLVPVILTATVYPFTSQPFKGKHAGVWLISPLAQDLLFTGFLYGLFNENFRGTIHPRIPIHRAVLITAVFFMLWHVPNFVGMNAGYVVFQLVYVFLGGAWILLARQITGSILPGVATHMVVNFLAVQGW